MAARKSGAKRAAKTPTKRGAAKKSAAPRETFEIARGPNDETDHMIAAAHAGVGDDRHAAVAPPAHVARVASADPGAESPAVPSEA